MRYQIPGKLPWIPFVSRVSTSSYRTQVLQPPSITTLKTGSYASIPSTVVVLPASDPPAFLPPWFDYRIFPHTPLGIGTICLAETAER